MLHRVPQEIADSIVRYALHDRAGVVSLLQSNSVNYHRAACEAYRVFKAGDENLEFVREFFSAPKTVSEGKRLVGNATTRVCAHVQVLIILTQNWAPTEMEIGLFGRLRSLRGTGFTLRDILDASRHPTLSRFLTEVNVWDSVHLAHLPETVTHVSVRARSRYDMPKGAALGALEQWARNNNLRHIGLELYDHTHAVWGLAITEQELATALAAIFREAPDMHVAVHVKGRAAENQHWGRWIRAANASEGAEGRVRFWRDERNKYAIGHDLHWDHPKDIRDDVKDALDGASFWTKAAVIGEDDRRLALQYPAAPDDSGATSAGTNKLAGGPL